MVTQDEEDKDTDIDPTLALRYWLRSRAKHLINSIKMKDKLFPPEVNLIESYQRCSYKLGASNEKFQMSEVYQYYSFTPIFFQIHHWPGHWKILRVKTVKKNASMLESLGNILCNWYQKTVTWHQICKRHKHSCLYHKIPSPGWNKCYIWPNSCGLSTTENETTENTTDCRRIQVQLPFVYEHPHCRPHNLPNHC